MKNTDEFSTGFRPLIIKAVIFAESEMTSHVVTAEFTHHDCVFLTENFDVQFLEFRRPRLVNVAVE